MATPRRSWVAVIVAVVALVAVVSSVALLTRGRSTGFEQRPVDPSAMPRLARDEVRAHGGGRCFEQQPTVFFCVLATAKQAHEGRSGREWCFDSDGAQTLSSYPAQRDDGRWTCPAS